MTITQRIRKSHNKNHNPVAEHGANAFKFDHISQAESLIKKKKGTVFTKRHNRPKMESLTPMRAKQDLTAVSTSPRNVTFNQ